MAPTSPARPLIGTLVIIGVGLIGGSFAAALKCKGEVKHVIGVGRNLDNMETALRLGLIDEISFSAAESVKKADFILLGMPVGQMPGVMQAIAESIPPGCVVSDAGSTKADVLAFARQYLGHHIERFVPAHPIAGAEHSGAAAARADLYRGKTIVVCAQPDSDASAVALVSRAWNLCGGIVQHMDAVTHDHVFAAVSHLPHLLAFALVDEIAHRDNADQLFSYAASGFRDFTRIASSSPEMWRDIALANRSALLLELDAYHTQLLRIRDLLFQSDGPALENVFTQARDRRNDWLASKE